MASRTLVEDARAKGAGGRLLTGMVILVAADIVGGAVAVLVDANTLGEAWSSKAVLAAPWPMILAQVGLTWGAVSRSARVAAGLLGVACAASAISGFFDGQLAREDLSAAVVAGQWVLVTVTAGVGALAFARLVELRRSPTRLTNPQPPPRALPWHGPSSTAPASPETSR